MAPGPDPYDSGTGSAGLGYEYTRAGVGNEARPSMDAYGAFQDEGRMPLPLEKEEREETSRTMQLAFNDPCEFSIGSPPSGPPGYPPLRPLSIPLYVPFPTPPGLLPKSRSLDPPIRESQGQLELTYHRRPNPSEPGWKSRTDGIRSTTYASGELLARWFARTANVWRGISMRWLLSYMILERTGIGNTLHL